MAAKMVRQNDTSGFLQFHKQIAKYDEKTYCTLSQFYVFIAECAIAFQKAYVRHGVEANMCENQPNRYEVLHLWPKEHVVGFPEIIITQKHVEAMYFTETYTRRLHA